MKKRPALLLAFILGLILVRGSARGEGDAIASWEVGHAPKYPHSGEAVTITARAPKEAADSKFILQYQIVEPGRYISKEDPKFEKNWNELSGTIASGGQWKFEVPAAIQKNRRLIRYRIASAGGGRRYAPDPEDSVPNYAFFVYDGVPAWRGAINPEGSPEERQVAEIPAEAMRRVQDYHLIAQKKSVEEATWTKQVPFGSPDDERKDYRWTGTFVGDDGTVYDHIRFRPRGGVWRHAMGKNMWKIDFNHGHKFQARDDYGRPYPAKWSKLNLGACIQQGDYGMRGEQGLFESVGFRLFNLAGVPAPLTHWVQWRIVDGEEETPKDQYEGDFWGLYLAVENPDGAFIKDHGIPNQSIFKMMSGQILVAVKGDDGLNEADVLKFEMTMRRGNLSESWWRTNVDLSTYYSYRSIVECIHHYDLDAGKNYDYRRDPASKRWVVVPWDIDLTWGEHMFGGGNEPFIAAGALRSQTARREYLNRQREILDLAFNPEQTGKLIDECARIVAAPGDRLSIAEADRRHWDWNPIMSSQWTLQSKSTPGAYYRASLTRDFGGMAQLMKSYVRRRRAFLEAHLFGNEGSLYTPKVKKDPSPAPVDGNYNFELDGGDAQTRYEWRLAETTPPPTGNAKPPAPGVMEITALWSGVSGTSCRIPSNLVQPGRLYRVRARAVDPDGVASHWSAPVEIQAH